MAPPQGAQFECTTRDTGPSPPLGFSIPRTVVRQTARQKAPTDGLCPSPSSRPPRGAQGPGAAGPESAGAPGRARESGQRGWAAARLSLSWRGSPGSTLQLHLFRAARLTEHPKQFQDYISLSHVFAKGVSQAPQGGGPAAPRAWRQAHRNPHSGTPGGAQSTPRNAPSSTRRGHTSVEPARRGRQPHRLTSAPLAQRQARAHGTAGRRGAVCTHTHSLSRTQTPGEPESSGQGHPEQPHPQARPPGSLR